MGTLFAGEVLGLLANLVAFWLLREGSKESLNVEGAYLEVLADTIGSVGVIAAAVLLEVFGWQWVDPLIGAGIVVATGVYTFNRERRLAADAAPPQQTKQGC